LDKTSMPKNRFAEMDSVDNKVAEVICPLHGEITKINKLSI
jgi:hypothetical protein